MHISRSSRFTSSCLHSAAATSLAFLLSAGTPALADEPPSFTQHPDPQSVPVGVNVLFSAQATSSLPVSYQWQVDGVDLEGKTGNTLGLFCVSMMQSGQVFTVVAANAAGAKTSSPALLQVSVPNAGRTPHTWGINPAAQHNHFFPYHLRDQVGAIYHADLFDLSLGALWGTDTYTDDSSLPAAVVHAGLLPAGQRGTVVVRISGPQSSFTGSSRHGIVSAEYGAYDGSFQLLGVVPTITRHPKAQARMAGGSAIFAVEAYGTGTLRYQWKHNGIDLTGETNATLQFVVDSTAQAGSYAVNVMDNLGTNTSDHAVLGVLPDAVGTPQRNEGVEWLSPGEFVRTVLTGNTNGGKIWGVGIYTTDQDLSTAVVHEGLLAHGETGVIAIVRLPEQPFFLGDTHNGVTSLPFGVYEAQAFLGRVPQVIADPVSKAVLAGQPAQLSVEAIHPLGYAIQWRKDGQTIVGATEAQLALDGAAPGTTAVYDAIVSVPGNPNVTQPAQVIVPPADAPIVTVSSPEEASIFMGQAGTLVYFPLSGSTNQGNPQLWGTGTYTDGSDIAAAAVHAGRLTPGQSATVGIYVGQWPSYYGSTRHGITSMGYGEYRGFTFVFPSAISAGPLLTLSAPGHLRIDNGIGHVCQIWAAPTLAPATWSLLDAFIPTNSMQAWTDTTAPTSQRFYRAVVLP